MAGLAREPELGISAPDFRLTGTDGALHALSDVQGERGTVVVFICNHCPYVKAITGRLVGAAEVLRAEGIGMAAICANDSTSHPADSFENMQQFAKERGFTFPYLHDADQIVARAYDAECTPDFFGLDAEGSILYRGRLDEGRKEPPAAGAKRELIDAMLMIARTGKAPVEQIPSVGCGIKWKAA